MKNRIAAFSLIVCAVLLAAFPSRTIADEKTKADPEVAVAAASVRLRVSPVALEG